jgi:hypothetical protein
MHPVQNTRQKSIARKMMILRQRPGSTRRQAAGVLGAYHDQTVLGLE